MPRHSETSGMSSPVIPRAASPTMPCSRWRDSTSRLSGDATAAQAAVTTLLEKYRTSESVPMAYVLAGRIVLMKGRGTEDVERALSQFERVEVFGESEAQSAALHFATEALSSSKRHTDALARQRQLQQRFPQSPWTVRSSLIAARSLVQLGQQQQAMKYLQPIRAAAPASPDAEAALAWQDGALSPVCPAGGEPARLCVHAASACGNSWQDARRARHPGDAVRRSRRGASRRRIRRGGHGSHGQQPDRHRCAACVPRHRWAGDAGAARRPESAGCRGVGVERPPSRTSP